MKLKRAIAAIVLVSVFAAPLAAGTFEDAVDAHARGDYAKALRLIRPLANDGNATAQFNLGVMYLTGHGVQQDYSAAALWFRKAAEQGYALAQSNLGTLYRDGRGVAQDDTEAVIWFRKAVDQGDAVAEFLLGNQYANGKGVPQDYSEAMIWFQRAAGQGHAVAKLYLGVMNAEGRGVPQDYVRAHMWFSLSAAQGEQGAVKLLEMAERRMTPAQITEARRSSHATGSRLRSHLLVSGAPIAVLMTALGQKAKYSLGADVFRFAPESGLKSDITPCPKGADSVAKVPKRCATNFPLKDEPSDNRRSMYPQARQRSCL